MKNNIPITFYFTLMLLLIIGCEDKTASKAETLPASGVVNGSINFSGTWPDSGTVLLTLDTQFPPMGPPAGSVTIANSDLVNNSFNYEFENIPFGEYAALLVSYWPNGYSSNGIYETLGIYMETITLNEENPEFTRDIDATFP